VARFQNPEKALTNPDSSMTIATVALEARWTGDEYLPFSSDGIVTLFRKIVTAESRQGTKQRLLQLNLSDKALSSLPDGSYRGVLLIEIRHY
jgi:hypothetical protein